MRFHTGDDPRWSEPGFDDSSWPLISSESDWSDQGYKDYGGFAWYRFKVILPRDHRQLGVYFPEHHDQLSGLCRGQTSGLIRRLSAQCGHIPTWPPSSAAAADSVAEMEIAIRVWHWPHWAMYFGGGISSPPRIGDADELKDWVTLQERNTYWEVSAQSYPALLNFLYGTAGFALFLMRPKERLTFGTAWPAFSSAARRLMPVFAAFHDVPEYDERGLHRWPCVVRGSSASWCSSG